MTSITTSLKSALTPAEARHRAEHPRGPSPHPMSYSAISLTVSPAWAADEIALMQRLTEIVKGRQDGGPHGPRDTGYRWQLDGSNDWWAELDSKGVVENRPTAILTVVHRYSPRKALALAGWAAVTFGGKVLHPTVWSHELARSGGKWLGAARSWIQTRFRNGSDVTWGSRDALEGAPVTAADIEEVAAAAAAAALNERNAG